MVLSRRGENEGDDNACFCDGIVVVTVACEELRYIRKLAGIR